MIETQIKAFNELWAGGYCEGNPLDPLSSSSYGKIGYMSVLYAAYLVCIRPYVNKESRVLEIGPGRGCWTRTLLKAGAKQVYCLDALSAEHNHFWEYVGDRENVKYYQVTDFECKELPDNHFDYLFSYGCFNHISPEGQEEYYKNLYQKLKPGAHAFVMFADYDKYNECIANYGSFSIGKFSKIRLDRKNDLKYQDKNEDRAVKSGRFYHNGTDNVVKTLERIGYRVLDRDCMVSHRDPVVHFVKAFS